jgi:hypothetical protein
MTKEQKIEILKLLAPGTPVYKVVKFGVRHRPTSWKNTVYFKKFDTRTHMVVVTETDILGTCFEYKWLTCDAIIAAEKLLGDGIDELSKDNWVIDPFKTFNDINIPSEKMNDFIGWSKKIHNSQK